MVIPNMIMQIQNIDICLQFYEFCYPSSVLACRMENIKVKIPNSDQWKYRKSQAARYSRVHANQTVKRPSGQRDRRQVYLYLDFQNVKGHNEMSLLYIFPRSFQYKNVLEVSGSLDCILFVNQFVYYNNNNIGVLYSANSKKSLRYFVHIDSRGGLYNYTF